MFTELLRGRGGRRAAQQQSAAEAVARRVARSKLLEALTAPHGVDRYVELVVPSFSTREVRAEVTRVHRQTSRSVTLTLRPNELWRGFRPGQFVTLSLEIDGVRRTRCYSPAGSAYAPGDSIELTVTEHPGGLVSTYLREHAHAGMIVELTQAEGEFVLPAELDGPLLLISGGSGITPVMSMLRTLCDERHEGPITFIHYARGSRDALYAPELADLARRNANVRVHHVYTRGRRAAPQPHFSIDALRAIDPALEQAEVYVCGPPGLQEAVREAWSANGQEQRFHSENFIPPSTIDLGEGIEGTIRFLGSEIEVESNGATLLEQAEQAGLEPAHACRMGVCHTCTCRKAAGRVRNVYTGELSSGEPEDIQICVSVPAGDVELEI